MNGFFQSCSRSDSTPTPPSPIEGEGDKAGSYGFSSPLMGEGWVGVILPTDYQVQPR
jgi:hypothetical protein